MAEVLLDEVLALVAVSPKRAATAAKKLAQRLGAGPEAIRVYDAVADACLAADPAWAAAPFSSARDLERELDRPLSLDRYPAFAARGALDERELIDLAARPGTEAILVDAVVHGVRATAALVEALSDREHARAVLLGWLRAGLLATLDLEVWRTAAPLVGELVRDDPALRTAAASALLGRSELGAKLLLGELGLTVDLSPAETAQLGESVLRAERVTPEVIVSTAATFRAIATALDRPLAVVVLTGDPRNRTLCDPALIEVALAHDVPLAIPPGAPETYVFPLWAWSRRAHPADQLDRVGAHPYFARVLAASFAPHHGAQAGEYLVHALSAAGCGCVFDALARWASEISTTWTLGALDIHATWLEAICRAEVLERVPALEHAVRDLDPARLFGNQLRAGILDEWGWPAYDEALARFAEPRQAKVWSGPFPYLVLCGEGRLIVVGPDAIVLDRPYQHPDGKIRYAYWIGGDALAINWGVERAHWVEGGGEPFVLGTTLHDLDLDGTVLTSNLLPFRRGDRSPPPGGSPPCYRLWRDHEACYAVAQEFTCGRGGVPGRIDRFDPATGEHTGHGLPAWLADRLATDDDRLIVHIQGTHLRPVPACAAQSPLGSRDGLGGFAVFTHGGEVSSEGIDGRRGPGQVGANYVVGLMTFPERPALYPIVQAAFDLGVAMPDGTPLVPIDKLDGPEYWGGTVGFDSLLYFHLLRPRDPAASRALATCTDDDARALLAAAAEPRATPEQVTDYGNMQAVLVAEPVAAPPTPALDDAIARVLPAVTHPRMIAGIAALASVARRLEATCTRLRGRLATTGARSALTNQHARALATVLDHQMPWWIEQLGTQLGQQILDVSAFLFGDAPGPVTPARTVVPWELALERMGELLYRLLAAGTPRSARDELRAFLALWSTTELAAHPERARLVSFALPQPCAPLDGLDREHPDRLLAWHNRYFVRSAGIQHGHAVVRAIEVTHDGVFRLPPGATLVEERRTDPRFSRDAIERALALFDERGPVSLASSSIAALADATGLNPAAATLVWAAGYEPWLAGTSVQETLGVSRDAMASAELELRGKRLRELYADAMPDDPAELYGDVAARLAAAWIARFGQAAPLPVDLIEAMRVDLQDAKLPLDRDARSLLDPDRASVLTVDATWVMRPAPGFDAGNRRFHGTLPSGWPVPAGASDARVDDDAHFHGYALSRFVRYLAWAHVALPGGDPARAGAARTGALLRERLAHPDLLVLAALVDLTTYSNTAFKTTPHADAATLFAEIRERFAGAPYVAADGGAAAPGYDRGDTVITWPAEQNGLFLAFRPHRLADDAALARFLDDVGARDAFERTQGAAPISVALGGSIICPAAFGHWLAWRSAGFQRLVDALHAPLPAGRHAADPRISSPDAVAHLCASLELDEAAAILRLQELVLPSVAAARITRINGWTVAEHDRARRSLDALQLPAPVPRAAHGLSTSDQPTFGVLLPLRPLSELFARAAGLPG